MQTRRNQHNIYRFSEWLDSPGGKKFSKSIAEMSKQELNDCLKSFYTSLRKQDGSYYKTTALLVIYISSYLARPRRITVMYTSLIYNITDI